MKSAALFFGAVCVITLNIAYAEPAHWVAPPKQDTFRRFKKVWMPFDSTSRTFSFFPAAKISDGGGLNYTYLRLSQPFDGDETNCCYGTYVNSKGETKPAICVLSQMGQTACSKVDPARCGDDKSIVGDKTDDTALNSGRGLKKVPSPPGRPTSPALPAPKSADDAT
jgi:hypothetical protein